MSLMMRRRMLLASKEEDTNLIKLSADTIRGAGSNYEILSKNSIKFYNPTNPSAVNSRFRTITFKITPNSKIQISFDFKRNYDSKTRFIVWKLSSLQSSSGTYITQYDVKANSREGSGIIILTVNNTATAEYLGIAFYMIENSAIDTAAELLISNLRAEYVE